MRSVPIFGAVAIVLGLSAAAADDQTTSTTPSTSTASDPSTSPTPPTSARALLKLPYIWKGSYVASVASACKDQTVYALHCTSHPDIPDASNFCGPDAPTLTATAGPSTFIASYGRMTTMDDQVLSVTTAENCHVAPSDTITCLGSWRLVPTSGVALPHDWPTAATGTMIGGHASSFYHQVAVTAGGDKLASATEACQPAATNGAVGVGPRGVWAVTGALVVGFLGMLV